MYTHTHTHTNIYGMETNYYCIFRIVIILQKKFM
jgi:hypothetical protein